MAYITKQEVEKYLGLSIKTTLDTFLTTLISAATAYIENYTGRWFEDDDTAATRYYDGNGCTKLAIDDLRDITSLTVDGEALTENEDYYLYPLNAATDGLPYEWIELIQPETKLKSSYNSRMDRGYPYVFEKGQRTVEVNGKWGYSTTPPDDIKTVCLKIVGGMIKENIGDTDLKEITQETLGAYSASFAKVREVANALGINTLLDNYVREPLRAKSGVVKI